MPSQDPAVLRRAQTTYREKKRRLVQAAKSVPCTDCGIQYPYWVMQFDHVPDKGKKESGINYLVNSGSWDVLVTELAKCEPVCANCHCNRTFSRKHWRASINPAVNIHEGTINK